jgi:hypothetical protein
MIPQSPTPSLTGVPVPIDLIHSNAVDIIGRPVSPRAVILLSCSIDLIALVVWGLYGLTIAVCGILMAYSIQTEKLHSIRSCYVISKLVFSIILLISALIVISGSDSPLFHNDAPGFLPYFAAVFAVTELYLTFKVKVALDKLALFPYENMNSIL